MRKLVWRRVLALALTLALCAAMAPAVLAAGFIEAVPCKYNEVDSDGFSDGLALVTLNDKYGFIDTTGKEVIPCQEGSFGNIHDGMATYSTGDYKFGYIQLTGADVSGFTDVNQYTYYADAVAWAADTGVTKGTSATTFSPASSVTRGQVVTFLWRAKGEPEATTTSNPFVDVNESDYYYKAVLWASENGITAGTDSTHFSPKQTCSRAHILTFLYRTLTGKSGTGGTKWYSIAMDWADEQGLQADMSQSPTADCPRSDIVVYLHRALAG